MISRHKFIRNNEEQKALFPTAHIQSFALILNIADPD